MKTEVWNGFKIRFVEINGEWWAVAKDIADALGYAETRNLTKLVPLEFLMSFILDGMNAKSTLISELGIYKAVFSSHKTEAEAFQEWVYNVLKTLREASGLEGFQVFSMMDKAHQKDAMERLQKGLGQTAVKVDFIVANQITNKAVSNRYGYPKLVKKADMTPEMKIDREIILDNVVELTTVKEKYGLDFSVKEKIYEKFGGSDR